MAGGGYIVIRLDDQPLAISFSSGGSVVHVLCVHPYLISDSRCCLCFLRLLSLQLRI